jgi:amino acid transporter
METGSSTSSGAGSSHGLRLRPNALGLVTVAGIGAVVMAPALSLYFVWGSIALTTGKIAPLIFALGLLISIPTLLSYAMVSKEIPSAGQAYTWLWRALRPEIGVWLGIIMFLYFMTGVWLVFMQNSIFFGEFLRYFGAPASPIENVIGVLILVGITAFVVFRDIRFNARIVIAFLFWESTVAAALGLTIIIVQATKGQLDLQPFNPASASSGFSGVSAAVIFGILAFIGYDYSSVVAEEAKTPRRLVPLAMVLATVIVGLYWIVFSYGYSEAVPLSQLSQFVNSGFEPVTPIAKIFWGPANILIAFTGLTATIGLCIAAVPVMARLLFAMSRDGALPPWLGKLNPKSLIPTNAALFVLLVALAGSLLMAALQRSFFNAFLWFGEVSVFFALVTYIAVNVASFAFYRRFRRHKFNIVLNLILPLTGIVIDAYVLWQSFFVTLLGIKGFALGSSVLFFALAVCVVGAGYVVWLRGRRPTVFKQDSYVLPEFEPQEALGSPGAS